MVHSGFKFFIGHPLFGVVLWCVERVQYTHSGAPIRMPVPFVEVQLWGCEVRDFPSYLHVAVSIFKNHVFKKSHVCTVAGKSLIKIGLSMSIKKYVLY